MDTVGSSETSLMIILVAGEGGVGKSTLIKHLTEGAYIPQRITVGMGVEVCTLVVDGVEHKITIKDAGGEERFRFMLPIWTKGAKGALLVFDLGRFHTFMHLSEWLDLMKESLSSDRILLVGAKYDIGNKREVDEEEARAFAEKAGMAGYIETSAMMGFQVRDAFEILLRQVIAAEQLPSMVANGS